MKSVQSKNCLNHGLHGLEDFTDLMARLNKTSNRNPRINTWRELMSK